MIRKAHVKRVYSPDHGPTDQYTAYVDLLRIDELETTLSTSNDGVTGQVQVLYIKWNDEEKYTDQNVDSRVTEDVTITIREDVAWGDKGEPRAVFTIKTAKSMVMNNSGQVYDWYFKNNTDNTAREVKTKRVTFRDMKTNAPNTPMDWETYKPLWRDAKENGAFYLPVEFVDQFFRTNSGQSDLVLFKRETIEEYFEDTKIKTDVVRLDPFQMIVNIYGQPEPIPPKTEEVNFSVTTEIKNTYLSGDWFEIGRYVPNWETPPSQFWSPLWKLVWSTVPYVPQQGEGTSGAVTTELLAEIYLSPTGHRYKGSGSATPAVYTSWEGYTSVGPFPTYPYIKYRLEYQAFSVSGTSVICTAEGNVATRGPVIIVPFGGHFLCDGSSIYGCAGPPITFPPGYEELIDWEIQHWEAGMYTYLYTIDAPSVPLGTVTVSLAGAHFTEKWRVKGKFKDFVYTITSIKPFPAVGRIEENPITFRTSVAIFTRPNDPELGE